MVLTRLPNPLAIATLNAGIAYNSIFFSFNCFLKLSGKSRANCSGDKSVFNKTRPLGLILDKISKL